MEATFVVVISPPIEIKGLVGMEFQNKNLQIDSFFRERHRCVGRSPAQSPPPIVRYLGHPIAHASWADKAKSDYLGMV